MMILLDSWDALLNILSRKNLPKNLDRAIAYCWKVRVVCTNVQIHLFCLWLWQVFFFNSMPNNLVYNEYIQICLNKGSVRSRQIEFWQTLKNVSSLPAMWSLVTTCFGFSSRSDNQTSLSVYIIRLLNSCPCTLQHTIDGTQIFSFIQISYRRL